MEKTEKTEICVVTPTWNNEDYTIRCFGSIAKNTKVPYRIIWVDNASEKPSREKVQKFLEENNIPHLAVLNEKNEGFVGGTNKGLEKALEINPSYIVFQNNDTEVFDGWDERLIRTAESDPNIGIVGPITSPCESWQSIENLKTRQEFSKIPEYDRGDHENFSRKIAETYEGQLMDVSMVAFFSTLFKTEAVRQIGFLSTDFGIGFGDDDDYCARAKKQKWRIVLAKDVFVFHNHRTTFKSRFSDEKIKSMQAANLAIFRKKHKSFFLESGNPLAVGYYTSLVRKGWNILRRNGLKVFLSDLAKFVKYGRKYF